jgi:hypothetical protein
VEWILLYLVFKDEPLVDILRLYQWEEGIAVHTTNMTYSDWLTLCVNIKQTFFQQTLHNEKQKMKILLYPMLPDFRNSMAFW